MTKTQEILLSMLAAIEDLSANQAVQVQFSSVQTTIAAAREAKGLALQANAASFDKLRQQIAGLA